MKREIINGTDNIKDGIKNLILSCAYALPNYIAKEKY